tara:strand:+ start:1002 stop:1229 length:228 start_codon:yes stop_codon:yes gene_type:complete
MKNKEDIKEIRSRLNASELEDLKYLYMEIGSFLKTDVVSLGGVITLENMLTSLNNFRQTYTRRVLNLMKQGNILD